MLPIHDADIRRSALKINQKFKNLIQFKASKSWINSFKKFYKIVRQKTTKFVSKSYSKNFRDIQNMVDKFVADVKPLFLEYPLDSIFNTDQSGFLKNFHSGRTFSYKIIKKVEVAVQLVTSTTHSYIIQPIINAAGELLLPLLICLAEPGGSFLKSRKFLIRLMCFY